jgi:hypothetical protein
MAGLTNLTKENAYVFRITHIKNLPWILHNGIHCRSSAQQDPNFVNIGNTELIGKRTLRPVPIHPFGTLADYVPFYFTPHSPMMYNIKTGYGGITKRSNDEIIILVSSLPQLLQNGSQFVYTDRHAYLATAQFSSDLTDLERLDWDIWRSRDFQRDSEDPGKVERYQAEALVFNNVPLSHLFGILTVNDATTATVHSLASGAGKTLDVKTMSNWYFT